MGSRASIKKCAIGGSPGGGTGIAMVARSTAPLVLDNPFNDVVVCGAALVVVVGVVGHVTPEANHRPVVAHKHVVIVAVRGSAQTGPPRLLVKRQQTAAAAIVHAHANIVAVMPVIGAAASGVVWLLLRLFLPTSDVRIMSSLCESMFGLYGAANRMASQRV